MPKDYVVYELQGESLKQVKAFYTLLAKALQANPIDWQGKNLRDIQNLQDNFFTEFYSAVEKNHPDLFKGLGLAENPVQIRSYQDGYPRAYHERVACYINPGQPSKAYIYSPVDYKGRHFIPAGAIQKTEKESESIGQALWAGGWSDPITVIPGKRKGTSIPADFDPAQHQAIETSHLSSDPKKPYRFFRAGGETLKLLQEFDMAKERYDRKVKQLFQALDNLKANLCKEGAIDGVKAPEDFYFNLMLGTDANGRPKLEISARLQGSGEALTIRDNPWFRVHPRTPGRKDYYVEPDASTPEGLALYDFFALVPDKPDQTEFPPALLSTDPVAPADQYDGMFGPLNKPLIRNFPQGTYLAYRSNPDSSGVFVPPGCSEISPAEFIWLEEDDKDRNSGVTLPPSPFSGPASGSHPAP